MKSTNQVQISGGVIEIHAALKPLGKGGINFFMRSVTSLDILTKYLVLNRLRCKDNDT